MEQRIEAFNKKREMRSNLLTVEINVIWLRPLGCTKRQNLTMLFLPDMRLTERCGKVKITRLERDTARGHK